MDSQITDVQRAARPGNVTYTDGYLIALAGFVVAVVGVMAGSLVLPVVAVLITLLGLLRAQWQSLLVLSFPIYGLVGALLSNVLIEDGAYITEQFRVGERTGATAALALFTCVFLIVGHFIVTSVTRRFFGRMVLSETSAASLLRTLVTGLSATLVLYAGVIVVFGSGWALAGARFEFWASLPPLIGPPMKLIHYYAVPAAFALAAYYFFNVKRAPKSLVVLLLLIPIAVFATGEKMSGFIVMATFFATGMGLAGIAHGSRKAITGRLIVASLVLGTALLWTTTLGYRAIGVQNPLLALEARSLLQGHVWYGIHRLVEFGPIVPLNELIRPDSLTSPSGLNRLGFLISPPEFLMPRLRAGISFTMGGPAAAIAGLGWVGGFVVWTLSAGLYAVSAWVAMHMIRLGNFIFAGVAFAYAFTVHQVTMMGNWEFLYHPIALAFYVVLLGTLLSSGAPSRRGGMATVTETPPAAEPYLVRSSSTPSSSTSTA